MLGIAGLPATDACLNESPSEKEGKFHTRVLLTRRISGLNESPSEKEGKSRFKNLHDAVPVASMKVPPKRKGNTAASFMHPRRWLRLNESPSEKEGK